MSSPAGSGRIRLIVEIVLGVMALAGGVFGFVANEARGEAQSQVQTLSVEVNVLSEGVESVAEERDRLREQVVELESQLSQDGDGGGETLTNPAGGSAFLHLDDNVALQQCTGIHEGMWSSDPIELKGQTYWNGFSCAPHNPWYSDPEVGSVDFKVPAGTERVTGVIGFDDNSADTTMSAEFLVHSVGSGAEELFSEVLVFGDVVELDVDLAGVERVRFEMRVRSTDFIGSDSQINPAILCWADMRFE